MKKIAAAFLLIILFACEKDNTDCYYCVTTHVTSVSVPLDGYPKSTKGSEINLCDQTEGDITMYKNTNKGESSSVYNGVTITDKWNTKCSIR